MNAAVRGVRPYSARFTVFVRHGSPATRPRLYSATRPAAHLKRATPASTARDAEAEAVLFDTLAGEAGDEEEEGTL